ncbi:ribosomal-processing cysteine protease Prp [Streptococcus sp. sy004]|uniref:ribosomal-processing cysteine protease Prp n=1 Tax=Streptococcus sp. sy004 TaxID=2600149 RepID=UPI0011B64085|nr:ribosomal-processing cysteine protease Prp [Streptococcus sp. sy004]TWT12003.1 ribosomal-processing cysteine protease Prp [Streptococcus sp. sy004]
MIKIEIIKKVSGQPLKVVLTGHAGSGEYGHDVMCASVSTLSLNLLNGLEVLADYQPSYHLNQKEGGYLQIDFSDFEKAPQQETARILYESFQLGVNQLGIDSPEFVQTKIITQD